MDIISILKRGNIILEFRVSEEPSYPDGINTPTHSSRKDPPFISRRAVPKKAIAFFPNCLLILIMFYHALVAVQN